MNNTTRNALERALPIVAAAYGRKFDARVVIGSNGSEVYTDGKTVVVPNVSQDYPAAVLWGFLGHECAHVRYTDFSVVTTQCVPGVHFALTNILEDGRIEKALAQDYPGTIADLREVCRYMSEKEFFQRTEADMAPVGLLQLYCLYFVRAKQLKQEVLNGHYADAKLHFGAAFPRGALVRLNALLRRGANLEDTQAAADLATEIMNMIKEEQEKQQEEQQLDNPQEEDGSDDGGQGDSQPDDSAGDDADGDQGDSPQDGSAGGSAGLDGSDGGDPDADGDDDQGQGGDSSGDGAGQDGDQADEAQGSQMTPQQAAETLKSILDAGEDDAIKDAVKALREEMQDSEQEAQAAGTSMVPGKGGASVAIPDGDKAPAYGDEHVGEQVYQAARSASSRIRQQLYGLVQASHRSTTRTARRGKRLDTSRIHRITVGDSRVFRRVTERSQPNTAVHLVVDMSSSMAYPTAEPYQVAREAALALAIALEAIPNVNPAVTFFGGYEQHLDDVVRPALRHGQRITKAVRQKFAIAPWGGTPMAEAIWYAGSEMVRAREDRKLLVVLSDGQPNDMHATHQALRLFGSAGVETIGIGIQDSSILNLIKNSVVIQDLSDLKGKLFELLEQSLAA